MISRRLGTITPVTRSMKSGDKDLLLLESRAAQTQVRGAGIMKTVKIKTHSLKNGLVERIEVGSGRNTMDGGQNN